MFAGSGKIQSTGWGRTNTDFFSLNILQAPPVNLPPCSSVLWGNVW